MDKTIRSNGPTSRNAIIITVSAAVLLIGLILTAVALYADENSPELRISGDKLEMLYGVDSIDVHFQDESFRNWYTCPNGQDSIRIEATVGKTEKTEEFITGIETFLPIGDSMELRGTTPANGCVKITLCYTKDPGNHKTTTIMVTEPSTASD